MAVVEPALALRAERAPVRLESSWGSDLVASLFLPSNGVRGIRSMNKSFDRKPLLPWADPRMTWIDSTF